MHSVFAKKKDHRESFKAEKIHMRKKHGIDYGHKPKAPTLLVFSGFFSPKQDFF